MGKRKNEGMLENISLLADSKFLGRFPEVDNVASFIASAADSTEGQGAVYSLFEDVGVSDIKGYLDLLDANNPLAVEKYNFIKRALHF